MPAFIARRLLQTVLVLIGISIVTWALMSIAPDDPARIYAQQFAAAGRATPEEVERARHKLGLTGSVVEQYGRWVGNIVRGDLGESFRNGRPVTREILDRLPATLELAAGGVLVTLLIGIPLGTVAALTANRWPDFLARIAALLAGAIPSFWLGLLLIWLFAVVLGLLPSVGRGGVENLVLPSVALGATGAGAYVRLLRASLLESLGQEYILAAKARGVGSWGVLFRHALRNALVPVVSQFGLTLGLLLSGAVVVEVIFAWPGIGRYAVDAIGRRDLTALQGFVLFSALVYVVANLVVDIAYRWLDPRIGTRAAK